MPGTLFATCFTIRDLDWVHSLEAYLIDVSNEFTQSIFLNDNTRFRVCIAKAYFVGTCHKDLEQISSILSVEIIFNIFYIYYCSRFRTCRWHGCCSLLKHILSIIDFCFRHSEGPISRLVTCASDQHPGTMWETFFLWTYFQFMPMAQ